MEWPNIICRPQNNKSGQPPTKKSWTKNQTKALAHTLEIVSKCHVLPKRQGGGRVGPWPRPLFQSPLKLTPPRRPIHRLCLARHACANKTPLFVFVPTCADNIVTMSVDDNQRTTNGASLGPPKNSESKTKKGAPGKKRRKIKWKTTTKKCYDGNLYRACTAQKMLCWLCY